MPGCGADGRPSKSGCETCAVWAPAASPAGSASVIWRAEMDAGG